MSQVTLPDFDTLWNHNKPAQTEAEFRKLLPHAQAAGDAPYYLELLTQIARAQGLQRQFEAAHTTLDTVEHYLNGQPARVVVRYLLERGRVFNSSKQRSDAYPFFMEAWNSATNIGEDAYAIDAAHMLAIISPPDQQHEWNCKALAIAENSLDPKARKWMGSLYNNIGWTYHDLGQYEDALRTFVKGLAWRESQGQVQEARIARWCVGRTLRSLGRLPEALAIQRDLAAQIQQAGESDGFVSEELAECLLATGQEAEARHYFAHAYQILSADQWLAENEPDRLARLEELGFS